MLTMEQFKPAIRLATIKDADKICSLFNKVSPKLKRNVDFWIWINRLLSQEKSIVAVAEYNDEIIGHYAIIPQEVLIEGEKFRVGFGIHAVLLEEKSRLVSIFEITSLAYRTAKELGLKFIYGFPNVSYRLIQEKIERWEKIQLFNAYETNINEYSIETNINEYIIEKIEDSYHSMFDIAKILENVSIKSNCSFSKTLTYYQYRYINHPHKLYDNYFIKDLFGNKACVFLKKHQAGDTIKGHLVDFIKEDNFKSENIIDIVALIFKNEGVDQLSFWPINIEIEKHLKNRGVAAEGFDTFFGLKFLDKDFKNSYREKLLNFNSWCLMMGDSDAF